MDNHRGRGDKMETWWGLEEAMDLLATSRRLTLRASRVSAVVTRWPLDLDSTSASSRLFQNRYRQPLRTSNLLPKVVEKKTELKGIESVSRPLSTITEHEELKNKLRNIQEENVKLQAVISDLTQVNKRWQKYNNDRQIYVQKLLNTIQDQQEQLNKMGEQRAFPTTEGEAECSLSDKNKMPFEHNVARLTDVERRLKEKVEVLEFQVKANRDDWEAEHNEKKQLIKEKEETERRVNLLMNELQELKQSVIEKRLPKDFSLLCQSCQLRFNYNNRNKQNNVTANNYPVHSKLYRTAVHLPCSSQQWHERLFTRASSNSLNNGLTIDGDCYNIDDDDDDTLGRKYNNIEAENKVINCDQKDSDTRKDTEDDCNSVCSFKSDFDNDPKNITNIWNIGLSSSASASDKKNIQNVGASASYSRASTVPLVSSPVFKDTITTSNASSTSSIALTTASLPDEPIQYQFSSNGGTTVTSFMQIPIVKSSSAPDSNSENLHNPFRSSLDSFNMASPSAPVAFIENAESCPDSRNKTYEKALAEGVETLTKQNIICPSCSAVFPPKIHLEFLDHYKTCQIINL